MSNAQIYSQGYRKYTGPRSGVPGAMRSLIKQSNRKALGIGRSARHKVVPLLVIISVYLPVIVFIGIAIVALRFEPFKNEIASLLPQYQDFYGWVDFLIVLLSAFVIPDLLCSDRRSGMLGVYLASPLNRVTYLASKAISTLQILLLVTFFPVLLLLIAYTLTDFGPDGFSGFMEIVLKIIFSSAVIGLFYVSTTLAISSFTDRKAFASIAFLAGTFGSSTVISILVVELDLPYSLRLFSFFELPMELVYRIFGSSAGWGYADNPTSTLWFMWLVTVLISLSLIWIQYRRLLVRR